MMDDFDIEIQADDYFDQFEDYLEWTNRFGDTLDYED